MKNDNILYNQNYNTKELKNDNIYAMKNDNILYTSDIYHFSWCKCYHFLRPRPTFLNVQDITIFHGVKVIILNSFMLHTGIGVRGLQGHCVYTVQLLALDGRDAELAGFVK
jgi:hypothetical protein